jgi:hypothetical protein
LPTTIAKRAEAKKQPATVLKLAIVKSRSSNPAAANFSGVAVARPKRPQ